MKKVAWPMCVPLDPWILVVTLAIKSRTLQISFVTAHSWFVSFCRSLWCVQKYSLMDVFSQSNRSIIFLSEVHLYHSTRKTEGVRDKQTPLQRHTSQRRDSGFRYRLMLRSISLFESRACEKSESNYSTCLLYTSPSPRDS